MISVGSAKYCMVRLTNSLQALDREATFSYHLDIVKDVYFKVSKL